MRISIDFDGSLWGNMKFFREFMKAMQSRGHEVGILTGHHMKTKEKDIRLMISRGFPEPDFYIGRPNDSEEHGGTFKPRMIKKHNIDIHFDDCDYRNPKTVRLMGDHPQVFQIHPRPPMNAHREDVFDVSGDKTAKKKRHEN